MSGFAKTKVEILTLPELNDIKLGAVPAFDAGSLAHQLGVKTQTLMHAVINRQSMYKVHTIAKKSGGRRLIHAPNGILKYVQGRVLSKILNPVEYPDHITAYVQERTTKHAAVQHAGNPVLVVIDIKNFFTSTRRSAVKKTLQVEFGYPYEVAALLADVMTVPYEFGDGIRHIVPQGAPTSGAICNWVAHCFFDKKIIKECEARGFTYTRYADDLAFSHSEKVSRKEVDALIRAVRKILREAHYLVNEKKVRVQRRGRQQRLLGMTINVKPNVMRHQYRKLRARIHNVEIKGFDQVAAEMGVGSGQKLRKQIEGTISYYQMINPQKAMRLQLQLELALAKRGEL